MTNPITAWIKSTMETYQDRESRMIDRVSETSINAQRMSDERHGPFKMHDCYRGEMRTRPNYRPTASISAYAGMEAGDTGSFRAMRYYQNGFATRRDEILTEIAKNE